MTLVLTEAKQTSDCATVAQQDSRTSSGLIRRLNERLGSGSGFVIHLRQPADLSCSTIGENIQQHFLYKPLESVYVISVHTPLSTLLLQYTLSRGDKGGKEPLWEALICAKIHTWLLHRLTLLSLNTSPKAVGGFMSEFLPLCSPETLSAACR